MKSFRACLVVLACVATPLAFAQWQWIDKDGRKVFSDQSPPPGTPNEKILKRPGTRWAEPEPAAAPASQAAAVPTVTGRDKGLEDKRKAASAAEAEKAKALDEETARLKADNCQRARQAKATLDSGARLSQANARGERELMDDKARAAEAKRLDEVMTRDCKA